MEAGCFGELLPPSVSRRDSDAEKSALSTPEYAASISLSQACRQAPCCVCDCRLPLPLCPSRPQAVVVNLTVRTELTEMLKLYGHVCEVQLLLLPLVDVQVRFSLSDITHTDPTI
jgi:hypothetical protein